jgi:hypothetical protein
MFQELLTSFGTIEEPRQVGKVDHLLIDVLAITVCAVLAGRVAKLVEIGKWRNLRVTQNHPTGGWHRLGDHAMTKTIDTSRRDMPKSW